MELALNKSPNPAGAPSGDHDLYAVLVDAAMQQRDEPALRQYAPLAEETATRINHKLYTAIAHRAWGVAHRLAEEYAEAERRLNLAVNTFAELGTRWQSGVTLFELGELARAQAHYTAASDYFSRALIAFEEMRAAPDSARTRAALVQVNESALAELAREQKAKAEVITTKEKFGGLTPREREVAILIAQGKSNPEIAEALVVSERTVTTHISNIFSKLGFTSRTQIASWATAKQLTRSET
jgi:DNA-binding CsgD family transcriptional regulator